MAHRAGAGAGAGAGGAGAGREGVSGGGSQTGDGDGRGGCQPVGTGADPQPGQRARLSAFPARARPKPPGMTTRIGPDTGPASSEERKRAYACGPPEQRRHDAEVGRGADQCDAHRIAAGGGRRGQRVQPALERAGDRAVRQEHRLSQQDVAGRVTVREGAGRGAEQQQRRHERGATPHSSRVFRSRRRRSESRPMYPSTASAGAANASWTYQWPRWALRITGRGRSAKSAPWCWPPAASSAPRCRRTTGRWREWRTAPGR